MIYGSARTKTEDVPGMLANREATWPVLLDPTAAFRKAQGFGVYPVATLVDAKGVARWNGDTSLRKTFADACEAEIKKLIAKPK